jgi:anti-sigma B factor antagonist
MPADEDTGYTVVRVRGDQDIATRVSLVVAIARAAQRDEGDVLVDLSGVTFMDASTIGALVGSRNRLRCRSQSLEVRAPSPRARRVLELCGLGGLIHSPVGNVHPRGDGAALGTWVHVPSSEANRELPAARRMSTAGASELDDRGA